MARIFITGSADGLGQLAANALIGQGHQVVLHARNKERAREALKGAPGAAEVLTGDLSSQEEVTALAEKANATGKFNAVIHNAGVYRVPAGSAGAEGWSLLLTVNVLAPYILTCTMQRPERLVYLSSDMHRQGSAETDHLSKLILKQGSGFSYSDTKLYDLVLALAIARKWAGVYSNAVNPGWVPTKMGGAGAPDSLQKGYETQVWLSASMDREAMVSGQYFHHKKPSPFHPAAADNAVQDQLIDLCERITGVRLEEVE